MYLESIFIGGDIRAQLPEEAKKFDNIDKLFKKVCGCSRFACVRLTLLHMCSAIVISFQCAVNI